MSMQVLKITLLVSCLLLGLCMVSAQAADVYNCNFEQGSQGSAFTLGGLTGQGTPAWTEGYSSGYDVGGVVTSDKAYAGTQSAYVQQYQTSQLDLGAVYRPKWIEWAFCPNLSAGGDQQPTSQLKMFNLRGPRGDMVGIYTWVEKQYGRLMFSSSAGNIDLGPAPDGVWKTVSFEHTIYAPTGVYTGAVNVYVDGVFKGAYSVANGTAYNGVQSTYFSTTSGSWTEDGAGYIDNIHMGDSSIFVLPVAATPTFSHNPGKYPYGSTQNVTISCATSGATIRYTTDGTEPSLTNGTLYTVPVAVSAALTLKAKAWKTGYTESATGSAAYDFYPQGVVYDCTFEQASQGSAFVLGDLTGQGTPAWTWGYSSSYDVGGVVTSATAYAGTQSAYVQQYQTSQLDLGAVYRPKWIEWAFCPNLSAGGDQQPTSTFKMFNLRGPRGDMYGIYTWVQKADGHLMFWSSAGNIDLGAAPDGVWKTVSFEHTIYAPTGVYTGAVNVYVDGAFKGAYSVGNGAAYNGVQSMYFSTTSGSWVEDGAGYFDNIHMGDSSIFVLPTVAVPTFNPPAGTYPYGSTQNVTISCATEGATIRYTTDGSEPSLTNPSATEYTVPVAVSNPKTLKAKAWKTGYTESATGSAAYTFLPVESIYDCGFETSEGYALGNLTGQGGSPAWTSNYFSSYDVGGVVTADQHSSGTQSAYLNNYQTSRLDLGAVYRPKWAEWSFMTNFAGGGMGGVPERVEMMSTRGVVSDMLGWWFRIHSDDMKLMLSTSSGEVDLGTITDQTWYRISIDHGGYSGSYTVYLNGQLKGTYTSPSGGFYNGLRNIVFSSAVPNGVSWGECGALYIDDIHLGYSSKHVTPTMSRPNSVPLDNGVVVDGQLTDWTDAEWAPLDTPYYQGVPGAPIDIPEAYYSLKWSDTANKVYFAVKVRDTSHYFNPEYVDWNLLDDVELYIHTDGYTGDYPNYQEPAQQYSIGFTGEGNGLWSAIGYPVTSGKTPVPAGAGFQCAGSIQGDWLYYEAAVTPFNYYGGIRGAANLVTTLAAGQKLGLDAVVGSVDSNYAFGMLSENDMSGKSGGFGSLGLHELAGAPSADKPIGMGNKTVATDSIVLTKLQGKPVRVWGRFVGAVSGGFEITDGYGTTNVTIKGSTSGLDTSKYVIVTGILNADRSVTASKITIFSN